MFKECSRGNSKKITVRTALAATNQQSNQLENSLLEKSNHFIEETTKAQLFIQ